MSGVVAVTVVMIMMAMKMIPMAMAGAVAGAGKLIGVTQLGRASSRLHTPKCFFSHVTEVWLWQPSHVFSHDSPLFHQHPLVSIYERPPKPPTIGTVSPGHWYLILS